VELTGSSEMLVRFYQTTCRHIPADKRHNNLRSHEVIIKSEHKIWEANLRHTHQLLFNILMSNGRNYTYVVRTRR
jgi:hypothetical protein